MSPDQSVCTLSKYLNQSATGKEQVINHQITQQLDTKGVQCLIVIAQFHPLNVKSFRSNICKSRTKYKTSKLNIYIFHHPSPYLAW